MAGVNQHRQSAEVATTSLSQSTTVTINLKSVPLTFAGGLSKERPWNVPEQPNTRSLQRALAFVIDSMKLVKLFRVSFQFVIALIERDGVFHLCAINTRVYM